ncbi:3-oxoacyl-ACP reductase [Actinophytocola xinjiangensis]|uniref:3-oxoacyl-ACP reductase n=1 Tax=Actinophytocola xinjiangensis TaxID=485602 RepID=A0A7Z1AVL7_9PSEU|nr:3-oxoacyl-ACP reductase [Actinophytocola xinjiangensis]OLF06573.1 3-oxoacyl-ACP reductase [Actinophytocola xinjiangensis]
MSLAGTAAIVTGAGAGLGRAEALALAAAGAGVVVNDLPGRAADTVADVEALGARALAVEGDVGDAATARALVDAAVEHFGGLHVVVNNAGLTRDRMLFNLSDQEWDEVLRVHLRGHFLLSRDACAYWRDRARATGGPTYGRVVNTSSEAFALGPPGQANYAAAKAGITALTLATDRAMARHGVTANAICPRARTAMTAHVFGPAPEGADPLSPDQVAPLVAYLASPASAGVHGQVFLVHSGMVALLAPPTVERRFDSPSWTPRELHDTVGAYLAGREATFAATTLTATEEEQ